MTSRERIETALNHREPDRVPLDLGGSYVSGMHVSSVYKLRQALGLDEPGTPIRVVEPYQMLGEIKPDLLEALRCDVVGLGGTRTFFGFPIEGWKPWTFFDGTPTLVPDVFDLEPDSQGNIKIYPQGDSSVPPCAVMPPGGYYFDVLDRQPPIDDDKLRVQDNLEEFAPISDAEVEHFRCESERLWTDTDKAVVAFFGGTSFGAMSVVPGMSLKQPKGIRDPEEWYISLKTRRDFIYSVFEKQCEIALKNLERIKDAVQNRVTAAFVTGTDFGMQNGLLISPQTYRDLFKPFHTIVNQWIHENTEWKTFMHSDGSLYDIIEDIVEAGFDILNPVQFSSVGMESKRLKEEFGDRLAFWGGGIDTQATLPFGTPEEVRQEARRQIETLGPDGGFVFTTVHNCQACVPDGNLVALYDAVKEYGEY